MDAVSVDRDECDACPAEAHVQAFVYAEMKSGNTVSYCSHHGTQYMVELTRQAVTVVDLRHLCHS